MAGVGSSDLPLHPESSSPGEGRIPAFMRGLALAEAGCLVAAGVAEVRDLAGLSDADVVKITGAQCSPELAILRSTAAAGVDIESRAPTQGSIRYLFPTLGGPNTPTMTGRACKAARVGGTGPALWQPPGEVPGREAKAPTGKDDALNPRPSSRMASSGQHGGRGPHECGTLYRPCWTSRSRTTTQWDGAPRW